MRGDWWTRTWNPVVGCSHTGQEGCKNCWAEKWAWRLAHNPGPAGDVYAQVVADGKWSGQVARHQLQPPTHGLHPQLIALAFMGDLWHPDVPIGWQAEVVAAIQANPRDTFAMVTKRPATAAQRLEEMVAPGDLQNAWLLASASTHMEASQACSKLAQVRGRVAKVGLHCEPLVAAIDLHSKVDIGGRWVPMGLAIDWLVVGGENGVNARPMYPAAVAQLRSDAKEYSLPMWLKGWGNAKPGRNNALDWTPEEQELRRHLVPQERPWTP